MKIAILGAGCIGCYVAGQLLKEKVSLVLIGRPYIGDSLKQHGLTVSDQDSQPLTFPPDTFEFSEAPEAMRDCSVILVCTKSHQTEQASQDIAHFRPDATVFSLQNGVHNAPKLSTALPDATVIPGTVVFNVVSLPGGHFHKATEGDIYLGEHPAAASLKALFAKTFQPVWHTDMRSVQYSKLLVNLNNPINAISDIPLKKELETRHFRKMLAACIYEGLEVYKAAGISPTSLGKVPVKWLPRLLNTPDIIFKLLAKQMLSIDPKARSSMWQDIQNGKPTEVDDLNGEIIRLGQLHYIRTPVNSQVLDQIHQLEQH
ncbi:2-dehydropantoate 2-reductase [Sansalvadorimonas sp. 2012CJ34-2]|uniref:2-dehydropantoate 2-reductase n=1 Tax=Parendozoicomonas callyspongiae TaxID=2942213 RepID=A0ABT0PI64_9GAMM|nr:2-dehydropantoate 2-reductase [Sansalvadorimonas sp. 2012CJ34-2]MCL6271062.1 2-dehydropantoate 2-reductase [Sansalvadorimonas sp. 2012CJ34-2]